MWGNTLWILYISLTGLMESTGWLFETSPREETIRKWDDFNLKELCKCMSKQSHHTRERQSLNGLKDTQLHLCFTGFIGFWWQKNFLIHMQEVFAFHHFTPNVYLRVSHLYLWKSINHCMTITLFNIILKCLFELSLLSAPPLHFFIKPTAARTYILHKSTDITIGKKEKKWKKNFSDMLQFLWAHNALI